MIRKIQMILLAGLILLFSACGQKETTAEQKEEQWPATPIPTPTTMPTATVTPTLVVQIVDTTAPEIQAEDIELYVGETISYKKNAVVTDNADGEITLEIDNSNVNLNEPGEYTLVYTATDAAGNVAVKEIQIVVKSFSDKQRDEEVDRLAEEVIGSLITENMSKWDSCYKLWNWCRTKIAWGYSEGERTIYAGAYEGLHDRKGDCYAYYATFMLFMEKLGIETMEVRRVGGNSNHWWCLVNLGDGWYHCDPSPRKTGHTYKCFMQTDEQVQDYTDYYTDHPNYYVFDKELYPERETEIVFESTIP